MKKLTIALIAIIYMGISSGIAMEIHYCMGKRAGVDFYATAKDKCGKCGMSGKKTGCCNDEYKFVKLNDCYKNVSNDVVFGIPDVADLHSYGNYKSTFKAAATALATQNHSPPGHTRPSAYIMNCVFRL